jgi:hypothetical protein
MPITRAQLDERAVVTDGRTSAVNSGPSLPQVQPVFQSHDWLRDAERRHILNIVIVEAKTGVRLS